MLKQHVGDWITVHARAERTPPRLSVTLRLGELPQAWARSQLHAKRPWPAILGLVLILPFATFISAGLLNSAGLHAPMQWIGASSIAIIAVTVSAFIGIPVAFVVNLLRITRIGLRRREGEVEGVIAMEFAPLDLVVILLAVVIGGLFLGHLAADSYACMNGVRSAC